MHGLAEALKKYVDAKIDLALQVADDSETEAAWALVDAALYGVMKDVAAIQRLYAKKKQVHEWLQ